MLKKRNKKGFILFEAVMAASILFGNVVFFSQGQRFLLHHIRLATQRTDLRQVLYEETREYRIWNGRNERTRQVPITSRIYFKHGKEGSTSVEIIHEKERILLEQEYLET